MGRVIPYIMENKKCLKPPTSYAYSCTWCFHLHAHWKGISDCHDCRRVHKFDQFWPSQSFFRTADILPAKYGLFSEHMTVNLQHCSIRFEVSSFPGCMLGKKSSSQPKWTIKSKQIKELQKVMFLPTSSQHTENQPVKCRPWPSLLS